METTITQKFDLLIAIINRVPTVTTGLAVRNTKDINHDIEAIYIKSIELIK